MPERGQPYAHLAADGKSHLLSDHLNSVGNLSGGFACEWGAKDWAYLAGLWHDLGKYSSAFQAYIRSANGLEAHIENVPGRVDHSSAGALHAVSRFEAAGLGTVGRILAYAIAGHHAGLADWAEEGAGTTPLSLRIAPQKSELLEAALNGSATGRPNTRLLNASLPTSRPKQGADPAFWIRMLFSSLVDADFLDTESFFDGRRARLRGAYPDISELLPVLEAHLDALDQKAPDTDVNRARREVRQACMRAAENDPGVFSESNNIRHSSFR